MSGTVLAFPQSEKAIKRRKRPEGMMAAGFLSLILLERDGGAIPDKVERFDEPQGRGLPERTPELLFSLLIWGELSKKKQEHVRQMLRCLVYSEKPDPVAVKLHNTLNRR